MSDRRRRSEASWNKTEDKTSLRWSNSEVNDDMLLGNHSGRSSWDSLQGNKNRPKGDDIRRDRQRMQTDPDIDEWGKQYSTRLSDDSYDMPYRSWDGGVNDSGHMSRDRDRPRSPYRSRNMSRSRSRSRNRDWENARTRSRSPPCDYDRNIDESNEYPNIRNNSRLSSRPCKDFSSRRGGGGNQKDNNNLTDSWSRRPGGSRDDDYHRDSRDNWNRNIYDDQDRRRHLNQNSRVVPCRYFSAGKCNRDDCKFSHESGSLVNKNSRWHDQQSHDDLNPKPNFGEKKKSWNGPSWDDVDSGGFDNIQGHTSEVKSRSWDDKKKLSDGPSWDDVKKSDSKPYADLNLKPNFGEKKKSWNGPSWDDVDSGGFDNIQGHTSDVKSRAWDEKKKFSDEPSWVDVSKSDSKPYDGLNPKPNFGEKKKSWNAPSWDDVDTDDYNIQGHTSDVKSRSWDVKKKLSDGPPWDDVRNSDSKPHDDLNPKPNFGEKKKSWNGPSWGDVDSGGFNNIQSHNSDVKSRSWDDEKRLSDGPSRDDVRKADSNLDDKHKSWNYSSRDGASGFSNVSKPNHYSDGNKSWNNNASGTLSEKPVGKTKKWNGPLWDEVSESGYSDVGKSSGGDMTCSDMQVQTDNKNRKWDGPERNEMASEKHDHLLPQRTSVTGLQPHTLDVQEQHVMPQALGGRYAMSSRTSTPAVFGAISVNMDIITEDANHQILTSGKDSIKDMNSQSLSYSNGTEQSHQMLPFSGPKIQLNRQFEGTFLHMGQTESKNKEGGKPLKTSEMDVPQVINEFNALPVSLPEMSPKGQLPHLYTNLNLSNAIDFLKSLPSSAYNQDTKPIEKDNSAAESMDVKTSPPIMSGSERQENLVFPPILTDGPTSTTQIGETRVIEKSPKTKNQGSHIRVAESATQEQEIINPDKVEGGDIPNDEKAMRLFKGPLVEFVKEILKPKWKEGKMSRDVHKNVVKKVVEKVTSTIQGIQIPRTQAKIDQYLACSKPKITKLVEAYVERLLKA